jgi:DNA topoisomerase I
LKSGKWLVCPNNKKTTAEEEKPKRRKKGAPAEEEPKVQCSYQELIEPPQPEPQPTQPATA